MPTREKPEPSPGPETQGAEPAVLLEDEWSSTPAVPIAPHPAWDFIRRPPIFDLANRVNVIWESSRVDDINQIFATRWNAADPDTTLPTSTVPQQVTVGPAAHETPAVVMLPGGDLLIAYETAQEDIHFRRAPFERLRTATERPVATSQRDREKFPFVLRSGTRLVFFWISADRHDPRPRWRARVRNYTSAWTEAEATWDPAHDLSQTGAYLGAGGASVFHAAVDEAGETWAAFQTEASMIQPFRFNPATGQTTQPFPVQVHGARSFNPAVVVEGDRAVWVLWDAGQRIYSLRFRRDLNPPQWEANPTPVPGAATGSDACPAAVCDAAGVIWLFWSRSRPDPNPPPDAYDRELLDLYLARYHPGTGWSEPFRVSTSPFSGFRSVPVLAPDGRIWLFWSGAVDGDGQADLYFKQLRTST
jgi:hypothetical protein